MKDIPNGLNPILYRRKWPPRSGPRPSMFGHNRLSRCVYQVATNTNHELSGATEHMQYILKIILEKLFPFQSICGREATNLPPKIIEKIPTDSRCLIEDLQMYSFSSEL